MILSAIIILVKALGVGVHTGISGYFWVNYNTSLYIVTINPTPNPNPLPPFE